MMLDATSDHLDVGPNVFSLRSVERFQTAKPHQTRSSVNGLAATIAQMLRPTILQSNFAPLSTFCLDAAI